MRRSQILRLARLTAALQYSPQIHELVRQKSQADQNLASGIAAQAAAARAIAHAARSARRPMRRAFNSEIRTDRAANRGVASDLASLGPGADPFRGAADSEAALATTIAARQRTQSLRGLSNLATNAAKGRAYAVLNLLTQHNQNVGNINSKLRELQGERGAAAEKGFLDLLGQQESNALKRRGQNITKRGQDLSHADRLRKLGVNPKTGKPMKGARGGGYTPTQIHKNTSDAKDAIREAQTWLARGTPIDLLRTGGKVPHNQPLVDPVKSTPKHPVYQTDSRGQVKVQRMTITVPQIDAIYIRAAQELRKFGHLTTATVRELRSRGVHVPRAWVPKIPGRTPGVYGPPAPGA